MNLNISTGFLEMSRDLGLADCWWYFEISFILVYIITYSYIYYYCHFFITLFLLKWIQENCILLGFFCLGLTIGLFMKHI